MLKPGPSGRLLLATGPVQHALKMAFHGFSGFVGGALLDGDEDGFVLLDRHGRVRHAATTEKAETVQVSAQASEGLGQEVISGVKGDYLVKEASAHRNSRKSR